MNWKNIIAEIQDKGSLTQSDIAKKCMTAQTTISSLVNRDGGEPGHALGERLKSLHAKCAKQPRKQRQTQEATNV